MAEYVNRNAIVKAIQWTGENADEIGAFLGKRRVQDKSFAGYNCCIITDNALMIYRNNQVEEQIVKVTDWIIKDSFDTLSVCSDKEFKTRFTTFYRPV